MILCHHSLLSWYHLGNSTLPPKYIWKTASPTFPTRLHLWLHEDQLFNCHPMSNGLLLAKIINVVKSRLADHLPSNRICHSTIWSIIKLLSLCLVSNWYCVLNLHKKWCTVAFLILTGQIGINKGWIICCCYKFRYWYFSRLVVFVEVA